MSSWSKAPARKPLFGDLDKEQVPGPGAYDADGRCIGDADAGGTGGWTTPRRQTQMTPSHHRAQPQHRTPHSALRMSVGGAALSSVKASPRLSAIRSRRTGRTADDSSSEILAAIASQGYAGEPAEIEVD